MDLLADTYVFHWWDSGDTKLSAASRSVISDPRNRVFVSATTVWGSVRFRAKMRENHKD
jgi:PIN domain nuclease of toxin-antitoxin system